MVFPSQRHMFILARYRLASSLRIAWAHPLTMEKPQEFNELLLQFLERKV